MYNEGGSLFDQVICVVLNYCVNVLLVDLLFCEVGLVDKEKGMLEDLLYGNVIIDGNLMLVNVIDDVLVMEEIIEILKVS